MENIFECSIFGFELFMIIEGSVNTPQKYIFAIKDISKGEELTYGHKLYLNSCEEIIM